MRELLAEKLTFVSGDDSFTKEQFVKAIKPYFADLVRVKRTNFLFVALNDQGLVMKGGVTGYKTDTTINVTVNSAVLASTKVGGKHAIYKLD